MFDIFWDRDNNLRRFNFNFNNNGSYDKCV